MSDSLRPCGLEHARLPCPSPSPGVCSNSCPLCQWCYASISSSAAPLSLGLLSFPASVLAALIISGTVTICSPECLFFRPPPSFRRVQWRPPQLPFPHLHLTPRPAAAWLPLPLHCCTETTDPHVPNDLSCQSWWALWCITSSSSLKLFLLLASPSGHCFSLCPSHPFGKHATRHLPCAGNGARCWDAKMSKNTLHPEGNCGAGDYYWWRTH